MTLTSVIYKMYCFILNKRLSSSDEHNGVITDNQNGFRKGRSTIDQLSTLTSIIETRKSRKQSTFAAFIDFKKAYDCINRDLLFTKLSKIGITGNMYHALVSIYKDVKCCLRLNGMHSDWFSVDCGLKQGCCLSPMLFNLYINDLVAQISSLGLGVDIDNEKLAILMYADDVVILGESEEDLKRILDVLNQWCNENELFINQEKSKVVHFRPKSVSRSSKAFKIGDKPISSVSNYMYLGLMLTEHLDYNVMAKNVSMSANRALGLVISKYKAFGGLPFGTFTKLYDSIVMGTISYGAAIWGDRTFACISAVQHRAARFFMGVGRYTPNAAVMGDIGWESVEVRQWDSIINHWHRLRSMDTNRLNFKVFIWAARRGNGRFKNWCGRVLSQFQKCDIANHFLDIDISQFSKHYVKEKVKTKLRGEFIHKCWENLERNTGRNGMNGNKLRTYRTFKTEYKTEGYINLALPRLHRSSYAKFRCGVAPLRIETGRYERLHLDDRHCFHCRNVIESEEHVILNCPLYEDFREKLFHTIRSNVTDFDGMSDNMKLSTILGNENINVTRSSAKTCHDILIRRRTLLYH